MGAKPDFYGILGVSRNATTPEIRDAFQKRASAFHAAGKPKNIDDVEEIRRYATACRVLSDPEKRQYYERTGSYLPETKLAGGMEAVADKESLCVAGEVLELLGEVGIVTDALGFIDLLS